MNVHLANGPGLFKLHPLLWRVLMTFAAFDISMGINFLVFTPTYFIFDQPNRVWAVALLVLGVIQFLVLNVIKKLSWVRAMQALGMLLYFLLAIGTSKPVVDGNGSAQLPVLYFWLAGVISLWCLLEAGVNPRTKKQ